MGCETWTDITPNARVYPVSCVITVKVLDNVVDNRQLERSGWTFGVVAVLIHHGNSRTTRCSTNAQANNNRHMTLWSSACQADNVAFLRKNGISCGAVILVVLEQIFCVRGRGVGASKNSTVSH